MGVIVVVVHRKISLMRPFRVQGDAGSFDCANAFASESIHSAQDDSF